MSNKARLHQKNMTSFRSALLGYVIVVLSVPITNVSTVWSVERSETLLNAARPLRYNRIGGRMFQTRYTAKDANKPGITARDLEQAWKNLNLGDRLDLRTIIKKIARVRDPQIGAVNHELKASISEELDVLASHLNLRVEELINPLNHEMTLDKNGTSYSHNGKYNLEHLSDKQLVEFVKIANEVVKRSTDDKVLSPLRQEVWRREMESHMLETGSNLTDLGRKIDEKYSTLKKVRDEMKTHLNELQHHLGEGIVLGEFYSDDNGGPLGSVLKEIRARKSIKKRTVWKLFSPVMERVQ